MWEWVLQGTVGLLSDHEILKKHRKKQAKQQQKIYISLARSVQFHREQHRCVNQHQGVCGPSFLLLPLILFPWFSPYKLFLPTLSISTFILLWILCLLSLPNFWDSTEADFCPGHIEQGGAWRCCCGGKQLGKRMPAGVQQAKLDREGPEKWCNGV